MRQSSLSSPRYAKGSSSFAFGDNQTASSANNVMDSAGESVLKQNSNSNVAGAAKPPSDRADVMNQPKPVISDDKEEVKRNPVRPVWHRPSIIELGSKNADRIGRVTATATKADDVFFSHPHQDQAGIDQATLSEQGSSEDSADSDSDGSTVDQLDKGKLGAPRVPFMMKANSSHAINSPSRQPSKDTIDGDRHDQDKRGSDSAAASAVPASGGVPKRLLQRMESKQGSAMLTSNVPYVKELSFRNVFPDTNK